MMRPEIVLFGDSITAQSFRSGGWGSSLTDAYSRKADVVVRGFITFSLSALRLLLLLRRYSLVQTMQLLKEEPVIGNMCRWMSTKIIVRRIVQQLKKC